jgi:AraC-like DNA-binding protein
MAEWCWIEPGATMTANAKSLTKSASPAPRVGPWSPTTSMADMRTFVNGFERLGHDVDALLAELDLTRRDLNDPDGRIACDMIGSLIARAQQKRFTPNLGLAIALATPPGAYPLLDYLVVTADTVGDALGQLARYLRVVTDSPVSFAVHADGDPVRVEIETVSTFGYEFEAALIVLRLREETDGAFAPIGISFQHRPDDVSGFELALGCPVRTKASWNGLAIARSTCELPMRRRDPVLRKFLESQGDAILANMPARTGIAMDVRRVLASRVVSGDTLMPAIARQLGLSKRTLHRRLAEDGVSFQELLEEVRKAAAGRYLDESPLAIGEIAYLLGYSEPAAFHRAFKRWYATTPEHFRTRSR